MEGKVYDPICSREDRTSKLSGGPKKIEII